MSQFKSLQSWLCHAVLWCGMALLAGLAQAHPMPTSSVFLDVHEGRVTVEMRLPVDRLAVGWGQALSPHPDAILRAHRDEFCRYLLQHVSLTDEEGKPWLAMWPQLDMMGAEPDTELWASINFVAPPGVTRENFLLNYDVITHEVLTHSVLVYLRQDWLAGRVGAESVLIGTIRYTVKQVSVTVGEGSAWRGFISVVRLGMSHIRDGIDHLLFLLTLLIVAPVRVEANAWHGMRERKDSAWKLLGVVTAFTLGHSLTLLLGGMALITVSARWVEVAVAITIMVTALHALRPIFPRYEMAVAGFFGLIHGMAFSSAIAELGLTLDQRLLTIFGFNLGIELMQLALLAIALPALLWLARHANYAIFRIGVAVYALLLALLWCVDRLQDASHPLQPLISQAEILTPWLLLVLGLMAWLWRKRSTDIAPNSQE